MSTRERETATPREGSKLSDSAFVYFQRLVASRIGVQLPDKAYLVESRLCEILQDRGFPDAEALIKEIRLGDAALASDAIEAMTTNETSFFRDIHPFETLATDVLPDMLERKKSGVLRIWNGACSSGQESYSLAMTLHEHFPEAAHPSKIKILSTDVSPIMVARTKEASYSRFEINRGLPAGHAEKYFEQEGRRWVAKPLLRELVSATELNLLEPWTRIPRCDVVVLRNVLFYFAPLVRQEILRRIRTEVLTPQGCLLLGATENFLETANGFQRRRVGRTALYHVDRSGRSGTTGANSWPRPFL